MGTVYLAVQSGDGFEKRVALKLIRRGMDTEFVIKRFLAERRILASLEHPNIARLYDGGATNDGLPWFVMEYVEGEHLLDYCDRRRLGIRERLGLFQQACEGAQYAHQGLVVHCDIKPGNILVTSDGTVKLLDFGVAKLLRSDTDPRTTELTAAMAKVFTPDYASPEQVRGERIMTGTDVFSLGVVLYQLLTGCHPHQEEMSSTEKLIWAICEKEPRPPSAVAQPDVARQLKGDLDTIVLKALQKEPGRRYSFVEHLHEDIRRYLEGFPITARPDTLTYRTRKFVRRHRTAVAATLLVAISLAGGGGEALWQASQAREGEAARWALATAAPEIRRLLAAGQSREGIALIRKARAVLPNDPTLESLWRQATVEPLLRAIHRAPRSRFDPIEEIRTPGKTSGGRRSKMSPCRRVSRRSMASLEARIRDRLHHRRLG